VSDTAKVISVLLTFALVMAVASTQMPVVPAIVLGVCGALLLNGFERYAAKRDLWPD
jgi:uncharacterized protein YqgC (DUF456 family)